MILDDGQFLANKNNKMEMQRRNQGGLSIICCSFEDTFWFKRSISFKLKSFWLCKALN